jgi:lipopolysaccharide biosynthesis glycosyltransferase
MHTIVVTAADEGYAPLLLDLIQSLGSGARTDFQIGCLDLGLGDETRARIGPAAQLVVPEWPFRPHPRFGAAPRHLSRAVRPFLPSYFPGHHTYIWLDADAWVQDLDAIGFLVAAASEGAMAVVPAVDRSYLHPPDARRWIYERYRMAHGEPEAQRLMLFSYINSGVFALRGDAPHWQAWAARFQHALDRWDGDFLSDQAIINALIYLDRAPASFLPAEYNWICHLGTPVWGHAERRFLGPNVPWTPISIIHNTLNDKQNIWRLPARGGGAVDTRLTYSGYRALIDVQNP